MLCTRVCLTALGSEREGEAQDRHLLAQCQTVSLSSPCPWHSRLPHPDTPAFAQVFVEMGYALPEQKLRIYVQDLEDPLVKHAAEFYKAASRVWVDQNSCPAYLEKAEVRIGGSARPGTFAAPAHTRAHAPDTGGAQVGARPRGSVPQPEHHGPAAAGLPRAPAQGGFHAPAPTSRSRACTGPPP
jgi:hypothetical protein